MALRVQNSGSVSFVNDTLFAKIFASPVEHNDCAGLVMPKQLFQRNSRLYR